MFVDTHCHIHDLEFADKFDQPADDMISDARRDGVEKLICVGTSVQSSRAAVKFAEHHSQCFASIALHPHEAGLLGDGQLAAAIDKIAALAAAKSPKLVAVGECGLDYYYHDYAEVRLKQQKLLKAHLEIAKKHGLPLIFHIRNAKTTDEKAVNSAFDDFFSIFDQYSGLEGVVHSFSASPKELKESLDRGLYIGLNGIMTFTDDEEQLKAAKLVPIDRLLLETDAPFLTPKPFRGRMCTPKHLRVTAEFLSKLRGVSLETLAAKTTENASRLFNLGETQE